VAWAGLARRELAASAPSESIPGAPARPGSITLARHGEPALSRRVRLTAAGYRDWGALYEEGGLKSDQAAPESLRKVARRAGVIIASTRPRSVQTARAVAEDMAFSQEPLLIEAPLPPPNLPAWLKLSPRLWGVVARFGWWFFDHHQGEESRSQAQARADVVAVRLIELASLGEEVLVVAHGFFNTMVGRALRRHGWRCTYDGGFRYWSARRFEAAIVRQPPPPITLPRGGRVG